MFDSFTLKSIFGWVETFEIQHDTLPYRSNYPYENENNPSSSYFITPYLEPWEELWFKDYTSNSFYQIFELVKAVDFFDINRLMESLAVFIGLELMEFGINQIYEILYKNDIYLPDNFDKLILYQILELKENIFNSKGDDFVEKKQNIPSFFNNLMWKCLWNKTDSLLSIKRFFKKFEFSDFALLFKTVGMYIKYDPAVIDLGRDILYPNVSQNKC